jgi:hypothetical protein
MRMMSRVEEFQIGEIKNESTGEETTSCVDG